MKRLELFLIFFFIALSVVSFVMARRGRQAGEADDVPVLAGDTIVSGGPAILYGASVLSLLAAIFLGYSYLQTEKSSSEIETRFGFPVYPAAVPENRVPVEVDGTTTFIFLTNNSPEEVAEFYRKEAETRGWDFSDPRTPGTRLLIVKKQDLKMTMTISPSKFSSGKNSIMIMIGKRE